MLAEIIKTHKEFLENQKSYRNFQEELTKISDILNKDKIVTLSGIRNSGKTRIVSELLKKSNSLEECFYFNSELDGIKHIQTGKDLLNLMDYYVRNHGNPKIVILQNCNNIKNIKEFILQLYKSKKYKIVIVGNNIKIQGVKNIEFYPLSMKQIPKGLRRYGGIPEVRIIPDTKYKIFLLESLKHQLISQDILEAYNIKNIHLFYRVMSYISNIDSFSSLRENHRNINESGIEIALLTMIDYINAALNTRLIHRIYRYDFKNSKTINSKAMYYFGDVGIRNSFLPNKDNTEKNALFLEFLQNGYEIFGGINGRFDFDFVAKNGKKEFLISFAESHEDKNEVRKRARKLSKIHGNYSRYVVVENIESLNIRKNDEDGVILLELDTLLKKI